MNKPTTGPWKSGETNLVGDGVGFIAIRGTVGPPVATVRWSRNENITQDDAEAIADLIASAPDLLEALKLAREHIDTEISPDGSVPVLTRVLLTAIDCAIEKAEGVNP